MARGRMISGTIGESRKFAALANDTHRLIYLMVMPHVDKAGRFEADPILIKGKCLTRLDVDASTVQAWLEDAANVGLIHHYEARGMHVLEIVNFKEHNTPHHKEPDSKLPGPEEGTPCSTPESNVEPSMSQARPKNGSTLPIIKGNRSKEKEREEKEMSSANADTPPPKPDEPTLRDLIEIWNSECGNLRRVADIELGLANTTLTRLSAAFFKRHRKRPDKGLDIFRAGIPAVVNDPHWLGPRADKPTRTGNVYGLDNYLRNVETKAEAAAAMTATGPSGRPTGPVRFRVGHAVYRPSTGEYDFIEELLDPKTARMSNGETWNLEGCERWTN